MNIDIKTKPLGILQVRETRESGYHRYCIAPGDDYSGYPAEVQAACAEAHTPEVIAAYQAMIAAARPPEPTIEQRRARMIVTMRQARLALLQSGLLANVESAIAGITDATERAAVQIEWEYAATVERTHAWVIALGAQLGLSETQMDDLFILAATL